MCAKIKIILHNLSHFGSVCAHCHWFYWEIRSSLNISNFLIQYEYILCKWSWMWHWMYHA